MTKSNSSVLQSTSKLYEHPWYAQLKLLGNTTNSESPSPQKPKSETPGQTCTSYCFHCQKDLPVDQFSKDRSRKCGVNRYCKSCTRAYSQHRKLYTLPEGQMCEACRIRPATDWDHFHHDMSHRGWLCHACNVGFGKFLNDPLLMTAGINYLITTYFEWQQNHELRLDELTSSLVPSTNTPAKATASVVSHRTGVSSGEVKVSECTN